MSLWAPRAGDTVIARTRAAPSGRVYTVKHAHNDHRFDLVGPRGAERTMVRGLDGSWTLFAYGRRKSRTEPCESVRPYAARRRETLVAAAGELLDGGGCKAEVALAEAALGRFSPVRKPTRPDDFAGRVRSECDAIAEMLIAKNAAYGNSALDPVRIFSKADPAEQIRVRIDDKLSRLARGSAAGEDTVRDLIGYLILLRLAEEG